MQPVKLPSWITGKWDMPTSKSAKWNSSKESFSTYPISNFSLIFSLLFSWLRRWYHIISWRHSYLSKFNSPLVKRIDTPNKALHSNSVLIDCQQLKERIPGYVRHGNSRNIYIQGRKQKLLPSTVHGQLC